jgi:hypothetical protein
MSQTENFAAMTFDHFFSAALARVAARVPRARGRVTVIGTAASGKPSYVIEANPHTLVTSTRCAVPSVPLRWQFPYFYLDGQHKIV